MNAAKIEKQRMIFALIKEEKMTRANGAYYCGMNYDAFRRKYARWLSEGEAAFTHGLKGKPSNNHTRIDYDKILELKSKPEYEKSNFSDFTFCLNKHEGIKVSYTSVYTYLIGKDILPPLQYRKKKKNMHPRRDAKDFEGEMVQMDATPFQFFKHFGDNSYIALHGAIDDATDKITGLYATENECAYGYFEVLRQTWENYGLPLSDYTDRLKFFDRASGEPTIDEQLAGEKKHVTQWQSMCRALDIKHILARSPQAKGRVERLWRTIQGILPSRIIKFNINTIEKLNAYLPQFIAEYNGRFAKFDNPVWRKPPADYERWLYYHAERKVNAAGEFSYLGVKMQCAEPKTRKSKVDICVGVSGIWTYSNGKFYAVKILDADVSESASGAFVKILSDTLKKSVKDDSEQVA